MKLLVITNIPNPYRIPLFNLLNQKLQARQHELHVAFGTSSYQRRKFVLNPSEFKFPYTVLDSGKMSLFGREGVLLTYSGIRKLVRHQQPDVVVVAGFSLATLKLFLLSLVSRVPYYIWSGVIHSPNRRQSLRQRWYRSLLAKRAKGGIAYGTRAGEYLRDLGIRTEGIQVAINTVDTTFFQEATCRYRQQQNQSTIAKKLVYVGYLTRGKRVDLLLRLVKQLAGQRNDFYLQIIGDGPEMAPLKEQAERLEIRSLVEFTGFVQKEELPRYLADAYVFLFPSEYDIWGLVLVEAMAAGIPVLASYKAGASLDLVQEGLNGWMINFEDIPLVAARVASLLSDPEMQARMSVEAVRFVQNNVTLEHSVAGFLNLFNEY